MFCSQCGNASKADQKFCANCGAAASGFAPPPATVGRDEAQGRNAGHVSGPLALWYWRLTEGQRIFAWSVSALLVLFYGVGLIPLAVLTFARLGSPGR